MGKKAVTVILLIAVLCGMIAGCRRQDEERSTEISFINGWGGTLKTHNTMLEIYNEFAKANTDINLKSTPYSDSSVAVKKANDMLAVGKMPDIISTNGLSYYVSNTVKRDMAMDLMPYIEQDEELMESIHPSVFEMWKTKEGALYTIPDVLEVAGYWYNKAYFEEAGIEDIPRTWEQFEEVITKLDGWILDTQQDITVSSLEQAQLSENLFLARLAGENVNGRMSAEDTSVDLDIQTISQTMNTLEKLKKVSSDAGNIENARQNFSDGKSILYFNGVWESDALSESKNKVQFQYAAYPTNDGETLAYISPSSGYVFAKQQDQEKAKASIRFLKYMLSENVQKKMAIRTGQAPSNPNVSSEDVEKENPVLGNAISAVYRADVQIKTIWSVWPEEKLQTVQEYCNQILQEKWETQFAQEMAERLNDKK